MKRHTADRQPRPPTHGRALSRRRRNLVRAVAHEALEGRRLLSAGDPDLAFGAADATAYFDTYLTDLVAMDTRGAVSAVAMKTGFATTVFTFGRTGSPADKVELFDIDPIDLKVGADGNVLLLGTAGGDANPGRQGVYRVGPAADFGGGDGFVPVGFDPATLDVAADGKIVVGGTRLAADGKRYMAAARFTADGRPDVAFGGGTGQVVTPYDVGDHGVYAVAMPGGRTALATTARNPTGVLTAGGRAYDPAVVRLTPVGAVDPAFAGGKGVRYVDLGAGDEVTAAALTPSGKILVGADVAGAFARPFRVAGDGGAYQLFERIYPGGESSVGDIAAGSDGKAVVWLKSGDANNLFGHYGSVVARYATDGTLDPSFGSGLGFRPSAGAVGSVQADNGILSAAPFLGYHSDGGAAVTKLTYAAGADPLGTAVDAAGTLSFNGTGGDDSILVYPVTTRYAPGAVRSSVAVEVNRYFRWAEAAAVKRIVAAAGGGDDRVLDDYDAAPATLDGGPGRDRLHGGGNADRLVGGGDDDTLDGRGGNDTLAGGDGSDTLLGGPGDDRLVASPGGDDLSGDGVWAPDDSYPPIDWLTTRAPAPAAAVPMAAAAGPAGGTDTVDYSASPAGVNVALGDLAASGHPGVLWTDNIRADVEVVEGSPQADLIVGSPAADALRGNGGNDQIYGGGGDDTLSGGTGNDRLGGEAGNDRVDGGTGADDLSGGAGVDALDYGRRTAALRVSLDGIADDGAAGEKDFARPDFEIVIGGTAGDAFYGSAGPETFYGNAGDDVIRGGGGNDTLDGGAGRDKLYGEAGNDTLRAADGAADTVDGGAGSDVAYADPADTLVSVVPVAKTDANGWSTFAPAADARVIYLDPAAGKDANGGLSSASPVATWGRAYSLARDGYPDQILVKRGTTVNAAVVNWAKSGRAAAQPIVVGSYGPATAARPKFVTGGSAVGFSTEGRADRLAAGVRVRHLALVGLEFTPGTADTTAVRRTGFSSAGGAEDLLLEDCVFRGYQDNVALQDAYAPLAGVKVRRCHILDAYGAGSSVPGAEFANRSQGLYADGVQGLLLDGNLFDHNGWNEAVAGAGANMYSHDAYLNTRNADVAVTGNVFARASGHGLQMRAGGYVKGNAFLADPFGLSLGFVNGGVTPGGVSGEVSGNLFVGSRDVPWDEGEWAMEVGNLRAAADGGGTLIADNLIVGDTTGTRSAVYLRADNNAVNPAQDVGINDLTLGGNTVYGWARGLTIDAALVPGTAGRTGLNGLTVVGNAFVANRLPPAVAHDAPFVGTAERWADNRYHVSGIDPAATPFSLAAAPLTLDGWRAAVEPTAAYGLPAYADPTRTAATYNATLGGPASLAAFLTAARGQSRAGWNPALTAGAVAAYVRGGFAVA